MKKTLLLQTALVAAAGLFVADIANAQTKEVPLGVTVGGYYTQLLQYQDRSPQAGQSDHGVKQDAEIYFNFRGVLANGTVIGGRVELEAGAYGDQIDEAYMFIEHAEFGRVEAGSMDSTTTKMIYGAPSALPSYSTTVQSEYSAVYNAPLMRFANNMDDTNHINLFSASNRYFGSKAGKGLQIGAGYSPDNCQDLTTVAATSVNATTGLQNGCGGGFFTPTGLEQQFNAAANYIESFGAFDVALYAGYNSVKVIGAGAATTPSSRESGKQGGALFTYNIGDGSSVQVGGAITDEDVTGARERKGWTAGARYLTNGAAPGSVGIGFEYADRNEKGAARAGDLEYWHVGLTYQVAAGILGFVGVGVADTTDTITAGSNADQTFGVVGLSLTF
ncbi:MAG: porin [Alphaproteobacteria bacterium]|nr:porin [Alphaproteobacteria bacterium]